MTTYFCQRPDSELLFRKGRFSHSSYILELWSLSLVQGGMPPLIATAPFPLGYVIPKQNELSCILEFHQNARKRTILTECIILTLS